MIIEELGERTKKDLRNYFGDRDFVVVAVPKEEPACLYVVRATRCVESARRIHPLQPPDVEVLGKALLGALLLTSLIKHATDQKVLLKLDSSEATVVAEADGRGRVRGFVERTQTQRQGTLSVTKELGMGTPYTSIVPLISNDVGENLSYYFSQSEQIPSALSVGVLFSGDGSVKHAGGFLLQTFGGTSEKVSQLLNHRIKAVGPITEMMEKGMRPEDVAVLLLEDLKPHLVGLKEVEYFCPCDERIARSSLSFLSKEELSEILLEGPAEVVCRFCRRVYRFGEKDL